MANYKYDNLNYYRQSLDGNWFKVDRNDDGYLTWVLPDGLRIQDTSFKVPTFMLVSGEPSKPIYTIATGANGSYDRYSSFQDAVKAYTEALDRGAFTDPSENILNDLMVVGGPAVKGVTSSIKLAPKAIKTVWNAGKSLLTKEGAKNAVKITLKETPKIGLSIAVGKGVDKTSQKLTGRTWGENVSEGLTSHWGFKVPSIIGDFTNPGYYGGYKYGNFITNNYSNLGRYTLDNLYPASYGLDKEHLVGLFNIATKPLYKKAPTFYNHRPKWFVNRYNKKSINDDVYLEARFENGANWTRISELEVPRKHFIKNSDGTVSPTHINTEPYNTALLPDKNDFKYIGDKVRSVDHLTPGKVGGEHSDYFYLGDDTAGNSAFEYIDIQKLNPQWLISDWLKNKFSLKDTSKTYKVINKLGGIDLSPMLGYRPFTIKAGYGITPKGEFIQIDPDYAKKILKTN